MEILLILSFALVLTSFVYDSQKAVDKLAKMDARERSYAIAKIMIAVIIFVASIILAFRLPEMISNTAETMVKISNH
jgi:Na+/proline symporter